MSKILVSPYWTTDEHAAVMALVNAAVAKTEHELAAARERCAWKAPHISRMEFRLGHLEIARLYLNDASAHYLEMERRNFSEFVDGVTP